MDLSFFMMPKEEKSNLFTKITLHVNETINLPVAKISGICIKLKFVPGALFLVFLTLSYILSFWILLKLETDGGRDQAVGKSSNKMTCGVWRKSCCAGGTTFFDTLKAMVTRYDLGS